MWDDLNAARRAIMQHITELDFGILSADEATVLMRRLGLVGDNWPVSLDDLAHDLKKAYGEVKALESSALAKIRAWEQETKR